MNIFESFRQSVDDILPPPLPCHFPCPPSDPLDFFVRFSNVCSSLVPVGIWVVLALILMLLVVPVSTLCIILARALQPVCTLHMGPQALFMLGIWVSVLI